VLISISKKEKNIAFEDPIVNEEDANNDIIINKNKNKGSFLQRDENISM